MSERVVEVIADLGNDARALPASDVQPRRQLVEVPIDFVHAGRTIRTRVTASENCVQFARRSRRADLPFAERR